MKLILATICLILTLSCSSTSQESEVAKDYFPQMKGCFLLYNLKTEKFEKVIGDQTCQERFPACSTFKVPLAVMAFDSGVLKDENQMLRWDGKKQFLEQWNRDHNAATWMSNSVVWFSQRITPKLGKKKFQTYLNNFDYGNKDLAGGITQAWLNSPNNSVGLKISGYEQIEFLKRLWKKQLPVSNRSMELTQKITYLETSPKGFKLSGKTGSNFYDKEKKVQFGWFISHITDGEKEYLTVANLSDLAPVETKSFGGRRSKEITKMILADLGLW